jgi:ADP-heptose:LPS heptosyltransferase
MRYFRKSPFAQARLAWIDLIYWVRSWFYPVLPLPTKVHSILIANPAHLGDAVITTAVIRALKAANPQINIDILCGSWSKPIFDDHPGVHNIYTLDLPKLNRAALSQSEKKVIYDKGFEVLHNVLKNKQYDLVASVYAYEPSYISVISSLLKVPIVGFSSAGYSSLLTRSYNTMNLPWHEVQHQAKILESILGEPLELARYTLWLPVTIKSVVSTKPYVVVHPGSGDASKEWDTECWRQVLEFLLAHQVNVVITGHGKREEVLAQSIAVDLKVENLVGKLSFAQFASCIEHASLVISLDSVAAHIASAHSVPAITLALGKTQIHRWLPLGSQATLLDWHSRKKSDDQKLLIDLKHLIASKLPPLDSKEGAL